MEQRRKDRKKYLAKNGFDWDSTELRRVKQSGGKSAPKNVQVPQREKQRPKAAVSNKKIGASYEKKLRYNQKWIDEFHTAVKLPVKQRKPADTN